MSPRPALRSPQERGILATLLYFDVFAHPLTAEEIVQFAPIPDLTPQLVDTVCRSTALRALVGEYEGFFYLVDRSKATVTRRRDREKHAMDLWLVATRMARMISWFPFVRGVFVSGELAKGVAGPDSDIDYVILTAEKRLWIARSLLILFKKIFLLNRRHYFCLNHFQTIGHLEAPSRSYYAAVEIVTLRPLSGPDTLREYWDSNRWIAGVLPNAIAPQRVEAGSPNVPLFRRLLESIVPNAAADRFDEWLRLRWERLWARRYPSLTPDERAHRFACTSGLSTAYGTDIADRIESAWTVRMIAHGLEQDPKVTA